MKVVFRLAQVVGADRDKPSFVGEMHRGTKIHHNKIRRLLSEPTVKVSSDEVSRICSWLVANNYADEDNVIGELFGRDPDDFWDALSRCEHITLCIGARTAEEWENSKYVMATDSRLQGVLMSRVSREKFKRQVSGGQSGEGSADQENAPSQRPRPAGLLSEFHMVDSPIRHAKPDQPGEGWEEACAQAQKIFDKVQAMPEVRALVALGSTKVNPIVELMLAEAFGIAPFQPQAANGREDRSCPIFFRYRETDPQPPSCCGGVQLPQCDKDTDPGIYFVDQSGGWSCFTCNEKSDAAFVFFDYYPQKGLLHMACGGFSARSTDLLTEHLDSIMAKITGLEPGSEARRVGLYVIAFPLTDRDKSTTQWKIRPVNLINRLAKRKKISRAEAKPAKRDRGTRRQANQGEPKTQRTRRASSESKARGKEG